MNRTYLRIMYPCFQITSSAISRSTRYLAPEFDNKRDVTLSIAGLELSILLKFDRMYVDPVGRVRWVLSANRTSRCTMRVYNVSGILVLRTENSGLR